MMDMSLPPVNSMTAFDPSLNTPLPSLDTPIPSLDTPIPSLDTPLHSLNTPVTLANSPFQRDMQLPDVRIKSVKSDVKDVPSLITPSSHPLAKSTPDLKSMAEPSTQPSSCAGPKNHQRDFMANFHEGVRLDHEQADQEVNYTHTQMML